MLHVSLTGLSRWPLKHYFWILPDRVFPEKIGIWVGGQSEAEGPSQCRWVSLNSLRAWVEWKSLRKLTLLCAWVFELGHQSPALSALAFWAFRLKSVPLALWLRSSIYHWSTGTPAGRKLIMGFLSLHNYISQHHQINLFIYILILFLWRSLTNTVRIPESWKQRLKPIHVHHVQNSTIYSSQNVEAVQRTT